MRTALSQKNLKKQNESRVSALEYKSYELCRRCVYAMDTDTIIFTHCICKAIDYHLYQIIKRCYIKG